MKNWSLYQSNIFAELSLSDQNLVIEARAGSGKSTVIEECNRRLPDSMGVLNIAFNRHIAEALRARLPRTREASTLNSIGWGIIRSVNRGAILNANKNHTFLMGCFNPYNPEERKRLAKIGGAVKRTVSLLKALNLPSWPSNWVELLDTYGVETGDFLPSDQFPYWAERTFEYSINDLSVWDFDDQIYQVIRQDYPIKQREIALIDETQDLSPVQIELVKRLGKRIIAVGDRNQAIYVFRGADLHAMERMISETEAKVLPLSICYRCSRAVVKKAQRYVPEIEAAPDAIEGGVEGIKRECFYKQLDGKELVTCRNTAPLIRECLRQLGRRQKAYVRGREIGDRIYELIERVGRLCRSDSLEIFLPALRNYAAAQTDKLLSTGRETEAELLSDRVESIICFAEEGETVQDVFEIMNSVFSDESKTGTEYSTIHKAKGRECPIVYRLEPELCPSSKTKPHLLPIERNLKYVEITRAQDTLYTIITEKR